MSERDGYARFWISPNDLDRVPGCGVFVDWHKHEDNKMWYCYPNDKSTRMNVRLVRTITKEQWDED